MDSYARVALPKHAAECGRLDELTADAGFLLCSEPSAVLRWRASLSTAQGLACLAVYQLSLGQADDDDYAIRASWLHTRAPWAAGSASGPSVPREPLPGP